MRTNSEILFQAKETLRSKWSEAIMVSLIYLVLNAIVSSTTSFTPFISSIAILAIAPIHVGFYKYFLDLKAGIVGDYNTLFIWFKDGYLRVVITYLMMSIYIFLWLLLLVVPGVVMSIAYSQTLFILATDSEITPQKALNKSRDMMRGYKMKYFLLNLRFIGWVLLSVLTLGVGFIWLIPYMVTAYVDFYNDVNSFYTGDNDSCCC